MARIKIGTPGGRHPGWHISQYQSAGCQNPLTGSRRSSHDVTAFYAMAVMANENFTPTFVFDAADLSDGEMLVFGDESVVFILVDSGGITVRGPFGGDEIHAGHCGRYVVDRPMTVSNVPNDSTHISWCRAHALSCAVRRSIPPSSRIEATEHLQTCFRLGLQFRSDDAGWVKRLRGALGEALVSAYAEGAGASGETVLPDVVLRARAYADSHFAESCDLARLADYAGVTKEYLVSLFRKHLGTTPVRYLWDIRVKNAVQLVNNTNLGLCDIADRCGYKSYFHMSRQIKKITGLSPQQLRRTSSSPATP